MNDSERDAFSRPRFFVKDRRDSKNRPIKDLCAMLVGIHILYCYYRAITCAIKPAATSE